MCVILDSKRDLTITTFPYGDSFLVLHVLISFFIFCIFSSKLISVILLSLKTSY